MKAYVIIYLNWKLTAEPLNRADAGGRLKSKFRLGFRMCEDNR